MAMTILNNSSSLLTLGWLNKNNASAVQSMLKIASGMKINSAADDASAYSISEKMRVQIRGLEQAVSNIQNDSAMMKTADGAVTSTLEIVRLLKEKAIDSANDSNNDADRATIQKEVDQLIDQVNDNAQITFNGKILLDGSTTPLSTYGATEQEAVVRGLNSAWIGDALDLIEESWGLTFEQPNNRYHKMKVEFVGGNTGKPSADENAVAYVSASGAKNYLTLSINMSQVQNIDIRDENGSNASGYLDRVIAHEMTHAIMFSKLGLSAMSRIGSSSLYIIEGGTAEMTQGADERDLVSAVSDPFADGNQYTGGFIASRFIAKHIGQSQQDTMKKFMRGLIACKGNADGAFSYVSGGAWKTEQAFKNAYNEALSRYGDNATKFLREECGINQYNRDTGAITGWDAENRVVKSNHSVVPQASRPINWSLPSSPETVIKGLMIEWPPGMYASPTAGSMVFHTGTTANHATKVSFFDMRARSIGLIDQEGKKLDVRTMGNARAAIGLLDKIINVILDEQTNIGAIQERLDYTNSNTVISNENVMGAESTIRDADMAKEMLEYTKSNTLSQASQAMLTRANQLTSDALKNIQPESNDTVEQSQETTSIENQNDENLTEVGKELKKITEGQKITSAGDDASAYGISEKMRVQIRGLDQSSENVKKGENILNIAELAVDQQIDIVKKMREIALKSSDAALAQEDRDVLQTELSQLGDQLQEIAVTTNYNGITLLDGRVKEKEVIYGATRYFNFDVNGEPTPNTIQALFPSTSTNTALGKPDVTGYGGTTVNGTRGTILEFEKYGRNADGGKLKPSDLNGQGFSVACGTCDMFVSIIFDGGRPLNTAEYIEGPATSYGRIAMEAYVVGIGGAKSFKDVYESLFKGIAKANDTSKNITLPDTDTVTQITKNHNVSIVKNGDSYAILKPQNPIVMYRI